jgi:hypothetical protein
VAIPSAAHTVAHHREASSELSSLWNELTCPSWPKTKRASEDKGAASACVTARSYTVWRFLMMFLAIRYDDLHISAGEGHSYVLDAVRIFARQIR